MSKRRVSRFGALLAVVSILGTSTLSLVTPSAAAADARPYATSTITKIYDGTGQSTPDGTFINEANGYVPGDNTPTDGVVASNDYVGYRVQSRFESGPDRVVEVFFDIPEYLEFDPDRNAGLCQSTAFATAVAITVDGKPGCSYDIKKGVGFAVVNDLTLTAKDTAGAIQYDQVTSINTGLAGQDNFTTHNAEGVIVVSAPTADLVLRPSTCSVNGSCSSVTAETNSGYLEVVVEALRWPGYNTHKGASTLGQWTAGLDVSDFPTGTTWSIGGNPLAPDANGILNLGPFTGTQQVAFVVPEDWGEEDFEAGEARSFDAHLIVPDTALATEDYRNNGTGWEPGQGKPAGFNTFNVEQTGARRGYAYPNNDWTSINVYKPLPVQGERFTKVQYRPWEANQTLWEQGNQEFSQDGAGETVNSAEAWWGIYKTGVRYAYWDVAPGTQLLTELVAFTNEFETEDSTKGLILSDEWDPQYVAADPSRDTYVTAPDGTRLTEGFTIQWSTTVTGEDAVDPSGSSGWITSKQAINGARSVRIIFDELPFGSDPSAGRYSLWVPTVVRADIPELEDAVTTVDTIRYWCEGCEGDPKKQVPISLVTMDTPVLGVSLNASTTELSRDDSTVSFTITPTVDALVNSIDPINGTLTLSLDPCINSYSVPDDSPWQFVEEDMSLSCGDEGSNTLTLSLKSDFVPALGMNEGKTTLPALSIDTVWSKIAEVTGSFSATWDLTSITGSEGGEAQQAGRISEVVPATDSTTISIAPHGEAGQYLTTSTAKAEVDQPLKFQAFVSASVSGQIGVGANSTVVVMPDRGNDASYRSQFDWWDGTPEQSSIHGTYEVASVEVAAKDSVPGTTVECTSDTNPSLDPAVNTWKSCSDIAGSAITAIRISQPGGVHQGVSTVDITLNPSGNEVDDVYLMWIGKVTGENPALNPGLSMPKYDTIVSSDISGYVYWDTSGRGVARGSGSAGIGGITVELLDSSGSVIDHATTDDEGYYEFFGYPSGTYRTQVPAIGAEGGVPKTMPSAFYPTRRIDVSQTYSYKNQRGSNASPTSSEIALGIDDEARNVNFGYYAPDPYSDLQKSASQIKCPPLGVTCDVSWDVTVKNGGKTRGSTGVIAMAGQYSLIIATTEGVFRTNSLGDKVEQVTGISGTPIAVAGDYEFLVATKSGVYFVNYENNQATLVEGISGTPIDVSGTSSEYAIATSDGLYLWSSSDQTPAEKVSALPGTPAAVAGSGPRRFGVITDEGVFQVKVEDGSVITVDGTSGVPLAISGTGNSYFGIITTEGAYWVGNGMPHIGSPDNQAVKVLGISGVPVALAGTDSGRAFAVATTGGVYRFTGGSPLPATSVSGIIGTVTELAGAGNVGMGLNYFAAITNAGMYVFVTDDTSPAIRVQGTTGVPLVVSGAGIPGIGNPPAPFALATTDDVYLVDPETAVVEPVTRDDGASWVGKAESSTGSAITLTGGKLTDSTSIEVYDLQATIGERIVAVTGDSPNSVGYGSGVATSSGYWLVDESANVAPVQGITGRPAAVVGERPMGGSSYGSAVATADGYWLVQSDGTAIKVEGIAGDPIVITGEYPLGDSGSAIATTEGYWLVDREGNSTKVSGVIGVPIAVTGGSPLISGQGSAVATTEGYWLVDGNGTATKVESITGSPIAVTGLNPKAGVSGGSGIITTGGYWMVTGSGAAMKVAGLTGTPVALTGDLPFATTGGSGVATSDGYWVVDSLRNATKAGAVTGTPIAITGTSPTLSGGSEVATTEGYWTVTGTGVAIPVSGISGKQVALAGSDPRSSGSGIATADGYWVVSSSGNATKAQNVTGIPVVTTGISPAQGGGSAVATSEGYWLVQPDGTSTRAGGVPVNVVELAPTAEYPSGANDGFIAREYQLPNLEPGEEVTVTLTGKVNRPGQWDPNGIGVASQGLVIGNQAWETFAQTPRTQPSLGIPSLPKPSLGSRFTYGNWTGNPTCTATEGWVVPGDQCDQVYASVPPVPIDLGVVSGFLWWDRAGTGQMDKPIPGNGYFLAGQKVVLWSGKNGEFSEKIAETFTDSQGFYIFESLVPNSDHQSAEDELPPMFGYYVTFELSANPTTSYRENGTWKTGSLLETDETGATKQGWAWTKTTAAPRGYMPFESASFAGMSKNLRVMGGGDKRLATNPVNGGVIVTEASLNVVKGTEKGPETKNLKEVEGTGKSDPQTVTIKITNNGKEPLVGFSWEDETLEGPALENLTCTIDTAGNPALTPSATFPPGRSATCTATLPAMDRLQTHRDEFTVSATGSISNTEVSDTDEWSATVEGLPSWNLTKLSDPTSGSTVKAGSSITYWLIASNTGELDLSNMVATDDLSQVIWNDKGERIATVEGCTYTESGTGGTLVLDECSLPSALTYTEDEATHTASLTWKVPPVRAGAGDSTSFSVKILDGAHGQTLINKVTGTIEDYRGPGMPLQPAQCDPDWFDRGNGGGDPVSEPGNDACSTTHQTPWSITLPMSGGATALIFLLLGLVGGGTALALWPKRKGGHAAK